MEFTQWKDAPQLILTLSCVIKGVMPLYTAVTAKSDDAIDHVGVIAQFLADFWWYG